MRQAVNLDRLSCAVLLLDQVALERSRSSVLNEHREVCSGLLQLHRAGLLFRLGLAAERSQLSFPCHRCATRYSPRCAMEASFQC